MQTVHIACTIVTTLGPKGIQCTKVFVYEYQQVCAFYTGCFMTILGVLVAFFGVYYTEVILY